MKGRTIETHKALRQNIFPLYPHAPGSLEDFVCMPSNAELLSRLHAVAEGASDFIYIYALPGEGRSHLLQGVCSALVNASKNAHYLPLRDMASFNPRELLSGISGHSVLCLDDVHAIAGDEAWEEALYHAYNAQQENRVAMVVSARLSPHRTPFVLEDLRSRFGSGLVYYLNQLDEETQTKLVHKHTKACGFELRDREWRYIVNRAQRSTGMLLDLVKQLDRASLSQKRHFSVPLIKELTGW